MKNGIIALGLIFGFYFVNAQDTQNQKIENETMESEYHEDYYEDGFEFNSEYEESNEVGAESSMETEGTTVTQTTKVKEKKKYKKDDSVFENIVEAPFKFIGTTVGEIGEGVGHIAWAPVKGIKNLFDGDKKEKEKAMVQYSNDGTKYSDGRVQNKETVKAKAKTEDDKYKYNSEYETDEKSNSEDIDYMYLP